jgi:hypothetical protein
MASTPSSSPTEVTINAPCLSQALHKGKEEAIGRQGPVIFYYVGTS